MHLAQLNIAKAKAPLDSPVLKDFVDNLDPINALAENSPGFIWRLKGDSGNATEIQFSEDPLMISNMSVWASLDSLKDFIFKTHHLEFLKRKKEWFEKMASAHQVMWWIPEGHIPSLEEANARLRYLDEHGETPYAFTFRKSYQSCDVSLEPA